MVNQLTDNRVSARVIIASQFAPPFMFSGVAVALPAMGADLHAGAIYLGLVETLFLASQLCFLLPAGKFADAGDKKSLYKFGVLGFGLCSLLIGITSWMPLILLLRLLQGVTSALISATGPAILAEVVPAERRGRAYGSSIGIIYAGLTLGPICAGYLVHAFGWRSVFLTGGGILLLGYALVSATLPSTWRRPAPRSVHIPSALLIAVAVLSAVAGSSLVNRGVVGYALLGLGVASTLTFIVLQRRVEHPLLNISALMGNAILRNALGIQLLLYMNAFSSLFMLNIYMQVSLHYSAQFSGQVLAAGTLLMAVVAPLSGTLSDRFRPARISSAGVFCVLIATALGLSLGRESGALYVGLIIAIQGMGFALFSSPNMTIIMNSAAADAVSMVSALGAKARSLGMMFGMLIVTVLISITMGNDRIDAHPELFIEIVTKAYLILATLTAIAFIISLNRGKQEELH